MPCKPLDLLNFAKQIDALDDEHEAVRRSVMSRSYYAALHMLIETLPDADMPDVSFGGSSHDRIINSAVVYAKGANPGRQCAAYAVKIMRKMKDARKIADYRLDDEVGLKLGKDSLIMAQEVFLNCSEIDRLRTQSRKIACP